METLHTHNFINNDKLGLMCACGEEHTHTYKLTKEELNEDTWRIIEVCDCGHTFTLLISKAKWNDFKGRNI